MDPTFQLFKAVNVEHVTLLLLIDISRYYLCIWLIIHVVTEKRVIYQIRSYISSDLGTSRMTWSQWLLVLRFAMSNRGHSFAKLKKKTWCVFQKDLTLRFYFVWWQQGHNRHDIQVRWNLKSFWCKFQNAKTWKKGLLIGYETHPPKKWTVWVVTAAGMNHAESFWLDIWLQAASVAAFPSGDHRLWYGYNLPPKSTDCRGRNYTELEADGNHIYEPPILQSKHVRKYNTSI